MHFEKLTETCWQLSHGSELDVAEQLLPTFLPRLLQLAPYHPQAAHLASQNLQLQSILVAHRLKLEQKIALCQQAVMYAKQADDRNILVAALLQLAVVFRYAQQQEKMFQTYLEALHYSEHTTPLLRSRVYCEAAEAFAKNGRKQEALFYLNFAYETFPEHPEQDPAFHFADCPYPVLFLYEGLVHLHLDQPRLALQSFEKRNTVLPAEKFPERIRLEIINHQGHAAIESNNLELYVHAFQEGITGTVALKSKKRYDEAVNLFHRHVPEGWRQEKQIQELTEEYQLRSQDR